MQRIPLHFGASAGLGCAWDGYEALMAGGRASGGQMGEWNTRWDPSRTMGNERTEAARRKEAGHFRGPFGGRGDPRSWLDQCCGVTVLLRRQKTRIPGSRSVGPGYAADRCGSIRRSFARCRVLAWAQQGRSGPYDTIAKSMRGGEGTDATNRSYDLPAPPALRAQLLMLLDSHGEPTRAGPALCFRTSVCEFLN